MIIHFSGFPGLLVLLSQPVCFLGMCHIVGSLIDLFFSLMMAYFTCTVISLRFILKAELKLKVCTLMLTGLTEQLPYRLPSQSGLHCDWLSSWRFRSSSLARCSAPSCKEKTKGSRTPRTSSLYFHLPVYNLTLKEFFLLSRKETT